MKNEEAILYLEDMKIKFEIPKAAVQARLNNEALDMAIKALEQPEPCKDTVSRQAAIDIVKSRKTAEQCEKGVVRNWAVDLCVDALEKLPSAQPKQRWIPVSERLPEDYGEFLVTYKSDGEQIFMDIIEYETSFEYDYEKNGFKGVWLFDGNRQDVNSEVIAWMPLPKPYQEGEQE